ncbi:MAG TPA: hypothetical protein VLN49_15330 [Gemmatimonadaceae bacterium]|nr:hypothetical protein [Gemmatimonadaceae bacterium]
MRITRILAAAGVVMAAPLQAQMMSESHSAAYPPLHVDPTLKDCSVEFASNLTQSAFHRFAREFGSVSAFKQLAPASTLRKGSISLGIEMMSFNVDEWSDAWNDTFAHPTDHHPLGSNHKFPKLKARVGITDNIDMGVFYARNPEANYGWVGLDGKYRVLTESENMPVSLAVRAAYTKTLYVTDMDMHAVTADVSVGRTVWYGIRPYVGLGADGVLARETSNAVNLRNENLIVPHVFGGFDVTLLRRVTLGAEFTQGALPSAQVQLGAVLF